MMTVWGVREVGGNLGKRLSSAWGVLLPCAIMLTLVLHDLSLLQLKCIIAAAFMVTLLMLCHRRLRHYLLLPSCVALTGGLAAALTTLSLN